GGREVERHATLVPVAAKPVAGERGEFAVGSPHRWAEVDACVCRRFRVLDRDHVGPEIGEHLRGVWPRDRPRQVEYPYAVQYTRHRTAPPRRTHTWPQIPGQMDF